MKVLSENNIQDIKNKIPKLYTSYGSNTDGAVTQKFIDDVLNSASIHLGNLSAASPSAGTAVGYHGNARGDYSVALGVYTVADQANSGAIGYGAKATRKGEINIGSTNSSGYEDGATRILGGVHAGLLDTDAVNLEQLKAKQDTLVSGTNIKTINGESVLGEGDLPIIVTPKSQTKYFGRTDDWELTKDRQTIISNYTPLGGTLHFYQLAIQMLVKSDITMPLTINIYATYNDTMVQTIASMPVYPMKAMTAVNAASLKNLSIFTLTPGYRYNWEKGLQASYHSQEEVKLVMRGAQNLYEYAI